MKRISSLCGLVAILSLVIWMTGSAEAGSVELPGPGDPPPCCQNLQHQACDYVGQVVSCTWGYYGPGYCQCFGGNVWGCMSTVPVPDEPVC
jgi:hypothetical protein